MSGTLEGEWELKSFSYHDVDYNYVLIKCDEKKVMPTYYDDCNRTPTDFRQYLNFYVKMLVDKDLNYYLNEDDLKHHNVAGKLISE